MKKQKTREKKNEINFVLLDRYHKRKTSDKTDQESLSNPRAFFTPRYLYAYRKGFCFIRLVNINIKHRAQWNAGKREKEMTHAL